MPFFLLVFNRVSEDLRIKESVTLNRITDSEFLCVDSSTKLAPKKMHNQQCQYIKFVLLKTKYLDKI